MASLRDANRNRVTEKLYRSRTRHCLLQRRLEGLRSKEGEVQNCLKAGREGEASDFLLLIDKLIADHRSLLLSYQESCLEVAEAAREEGDWLSQQ